MKRTLLYLTTFILMMSVVHALTLDANQPTRNRDFRNDDPSSVLFGQSFLAESTGTLNTVEFRACKYGSGGSDAQLEIWNVTKVGGSYYADQLLEPYANLTTAELSTCGVGVAINKTSVGDSVEITDGERYAIVWRRLGSADSSNRMGFDANDSKVSYLEGNGSRSATGATWLNDLGGLDFYFKIFVGPTEESIPSVINSSILCSSCNIPDGDNQSPYTTPDTTPTFKFNTTKNAWCRIGDENINYTAMGSGRDCAGGQGAVDHTCSLPTQDELVNDVDYVYVTCADTVGKFNASGEVTLLMNITDLALNASRKIDMGIQNSVIGSGVTIYSDQQIFLRDLQDNKVVGTVERVAVYGNQRWIFNFVESGPLLGLFNITPVVYSLEITNTSLSEIETIVENFINNTKN